MRFAAKHQCRLPANLRKSALGRKQTLGRNSCPAGLHPCFRAGRLLALARHATAREGDEVEEVEEPPNSLVQGYRARLFGKDDLVNFRGLIMPGLTRQPPSLLPSKHRRIPAECRDGGGGL